MTTQESAPAFKSGVNLVLVPVVVRDRQGNAIGTLKKNDFALFDRKKSQTISRFSVENNGAREPGTKTDSVPGEAAADAVTAAARQNRFIAYVFDDLHTSFGDFARVQKAAVQHLASALQPADRAAIFTTSSQGGIDFTDDRAKLQDAVMKLRIHPMFAQETNTCPYMSYYLADLIVNKNNQQALQAAVQDTIVCENLNGPGAQQMAQAAVEGAAHRMIPMGEQDARVTLAVIRDVVRRISAMPGQRLVVLASSGLLTLTTESFAQKTDILDRAARGNVTISALDARGLYTDSSMDASQQGTATVQLGILRQQYMRDSDRADSDTLAELVAGTGGTFFENSNDLEAGFNRVAAVPKYVYLLGFSPQNLKADGSYHKLTVTIPEQKGFSIQARRGYYAPRHTATEEETAKAEIQDAIFSREEERDIPVDLHTQFFKPDPADAKLTVLARVDVKRLRFKKVDGRNRDGLTIVTALFDRNGNYVSGIRKTIDMRLKDTTLDRLNSGITVRTTFDVKPGTYLVRLVVRDDQEQRISMQNGTVDIP